MALPGLVIKIAGESSDAVRELNRTETALEGVGQKGKGTGDKLRAMQGPALAAVGAIAGGAVLAVNAASDLEQATGAVTAVFGDQTDAMLKAAEASTDLGLSTAAYSDNAAILGALLKNTGTETDALAGQTQTLIGLSADMAAQFGGSTNDAVGAISSALKGQYDVLDNYGVKLTAAQVSAYAAENGISNAAAATELLTEQLEQTGTIGAASRELDTVAGSSAKAKAEMENATAALGEALLPVVADAAELLAEMADWVQENVDIIGPLVAIVGAFAAVIVTLNAAMSIYATIQAIANITLLGFPLVWIIAAIVAVVAAIVVLYKNWSKITDFFKDSWQKIVGAFRDAVDKIKGFFAGLGDTVKGFINGIIDNINSLINAFNKLPGPDIPNIPNVRTATTSRALARNAATRYAPTSSATPTNITIQAGIGDPAAIARQIRDLLRYDAVRVGIR